jgi:hypothetical protein
MSLSRRQFTNWQKGEACYKAAIGSINCLASRKTGTRPVARSLVQLGTFPLPFSSLQRTAPISNATIFRIVLQQCYHHFIAQEIGSGFELHGFSNSEVPKPLS